jgi:hypothetical protein
MFVLVRLQRVLDILKFERHSSNHTLKASRIRHGQRAGKEASKRAGGVA